MNNSTALIITYCNKPPNYPYSSRCFNHKDKIRFYITEHSPIIKYILKIKVDIYDTYIVVTASKYQKDGLEIRSWIDEVETYTEFTNLLHKIREEAKD